MLAFDGTAVRSETGSGLKERLNIDAARIRAGSTRSTLQMLYRKQVCNPAHFQQSAA
jgi:hypothetical protein